MYFGSSLRNFYESWCCNSIFLYFFLKLCFLFTYALISSVYIFICDRSYEPTFPHMSNQCSRPFFPHSLDIYVSVCFLPVHVQLISLSFNCILLWLLWFTGIFLFGRWVIPYFSSHCLADLHLDSSGFFSISISVEKPIEIFLKEWHWIGRLL